MRHLKRIVAAAAAVPLAVGISFVAAAGPASASPTVPGPSQNANCIASGYAAPGAPATISVSQLAHAYHIPNGPDIVGFLASENC